MMIKSLMNSAGTLCLSMLVVSGCASTAAQPPPETSAAVEESPPEPEALAEAPECVDDKDQPVQCLADSDCCSGFVCGKDPERSHHVSYCIYGG